MCLLQETAATTTITHAVAAASAATVSATALAALAAALATLAAAAVPASAAALAAATLSTPLHDQLARGRTSLPMHSYLLPLPHTRAGLPVLQVPCGMMGGGFSNPKRMA